MLSFKLISTLVYFTVVVETPLRPKQGGEEKEEEHPG